MSKAPRVFAKGMRTEIAPYRDGHCFRHFGHLDGEEGVIIKVEGAGQKMGVFVKLDGALSPVRYPAAIVRPISG